MEYPLKRFNEYADRITDNKRVLFEYLLSEVDRVSGGAITEEDASYDIASLMATKFVMSLPDNDPIMEVLALAGQLELPRRHRDDDVSWAFFVQKIYDLTSA